MDKSASKKSTGSASKSSSNSSNKSSGHKKLKLLKTEPPLQNSTGHETGDMQDRFDAIFLTPEAVENFVVPFYNSGKGGRDGDGLGTRMLEAFKSHPDQVYALAHMPDCQSRYLVGDQASQKDKPGSTALRILTLEEVEQLPGSAGRS